MVTFYGCMVIRKTHTMELISNRVEGNNGYFDAKARLQWSSFLVHLRVQDYVVIKKKACKILYKKYHKYQISIPIESIATYIYKTLERDHP